MYEELVKRLRDQDNCNVLDDVDEAADAIEALEKQLAEAEATADHEHCRYIETLGERDGMEDRCRIVEKQLAEKESEIVRIRENWSNTISDLSSVTTKQWIEKASDNTDFVLAYADGLYSISDGKGRILCEFIRDSGADVCVVSQTVGGEKVETL